MNFIYSKLSVKENERIFKKVSINKKTGCWEWTGSKDGGGYGLLWFKGRTERIHRVIYSVFVQPVPRGGVQQIDHLCRNTSCCNPAHLDLVTKKQNILRGQGITAQNARKTHCPKGHLLPEYTGAMRRYCKECDNVRHKARMSGENRKYWLAKSNEATKRYYRKNKRRKTT